MLKDTGPLGKQSTCYGCLIETIKNKFVMQLHGVAASSPNATLGPYSVIFCFSSPPASTFAPAHILPLLKTRCTRTNCAAVVS